VPVTPLAVKVVVAVAQIVLAAAVTDVIDTGVFTFTVTVCVDGHKVVFGVIVSV
jgi:hypothetical protein